MKHVIGNLREQHYESLYSSEEYLFVQKGLADESLDVLCRFCEHAWRANLACRLPQWFLRELGGVQTPGDLFAIGPKFVRTSIRHLRSYSHALARGPARPRQ